VDCHNEKGEASPEKECGRLQSGVSFMGVYDAEVMSLPKHNQEKNYSVGLTGHEDALPKRKTSRFLLPSSDEEPDSFSFLNLSGVFHLHRYTATSLISRSPL
jgi:hypothetical protein